MQVEHIHKAILPALEERELEALQQRIRVHFPGVDPCAITNKDMAHAMLAEDSEKRVGSLQFFNLNRYILPSTSTFIANDVFDCL